MMGGCDMWGWLICITVNTGMTGGRYHLIVFFSCAFLFFSLAFSVPLYRWLEDGGCWVCFFVFFALFLSLVSLTNAYKLLHKISVIICVLKNFFKSQVSDHYFVDIFAKGWVFWFQWVFRVCLPYSTYH